VDQGSRINKGKKLSRGGRDQGDRKYETGDRSKAQNKPEPGQYWGKVRTRH
jgi:hypothetical protein